MNRATFLAKFLVSFSLAVLLLFGLTVPAHALTTLTSSLLFLGFGSGVSLICTITNVGAAPITVTLQVVDDNGAVVNSATSPLPPGEGGALPHAGPVSAYCKFTGNFNRGFVRANAQIVDNTTLRAIVVVPAQAVGE